MSRVFSLRTVLRQTPNRLLREFLKQQGHEGLEIPWETLKERDIEIIADQLNQLPPHQFDVIEIALHTVHDLACSTGIAAIRDARLQTSLENIADQPGLPEEGNLYEQAMWACLNWREAVELATITHSLDRLTWWRRRTELPRIVPNTAPETLAQLGREISQLLRVVEGRGRNCTVEAYNRRGTVCYFAFPDDFVQGATTHDPQGLLTPIAIRRTFTVVFAYDPTAGSLELFAKVSATLKLDLERLFARVVLGIELDEYRAPIAYEPESLREREFQTATDPEDCLRVDVRQLRLSLSNGRHITLRGNPEEPGDTIRLLQELVSQNALVESDYLVTLITFCFEFEPAGSRRASRVTFDVSYPNSCSLRNQRPDREALIRKYLTRWGISVGHSTATDSATLGSNQSHLPTVGDGTVF